MHTIFFCVYFLHELEMIQSCADLQIFVLFLFRQLA